LIPIDFEALFARSPNPYVVMDPALTLVWMNDAYLNVTMRAREAITGRTMFEAFPSDPESASHRQLQESFDRVLATGEADEIALIRYDIERADGSMDERYWSATHTPMMEGGKVAWILQHTVDVTELHGLRRLRDEMGVVQRASVIQARNRRMFDEVLRLRSLVEQAPGFVAIVSEPQHVFRLANQAYRELIGDRPLIGRPAAEALPEVVDQGFITLLDTVRESARAYVARRARVLLRDAKGRTRERFLDFIFQPILSPSDGTVNGIFVQGYDVTDQVEAQERQRLLINELNHRVKNTLAIVQSLANQSFRHVSSAEVARRTFEARLNALAAAHSLLTESNWESAHLRDTVRAAVEATAGEAIDRIHIEGPDFALQPQTAVSLAMIIHELATNAIKYGALSTDTGRVEVRWAITQQDGDCHLLIDWIESGGPAVTQPSRRGFGTRLIERGMSAERSSAVAIRFEAEGLRCSIGAILPRATT